MATYKQGLDYFPLNVDFFESDKLQLVSARYGLKGESLALRLLCRIYAGGYFSRFGEDEIILFAKRAGDNCQPAFVKDVLREMIKRDFFDKNIYEQFEILTSEGIQRRYFEATGRRKHIYLREELLLIDLSKIPNVNILTQNAYIIEENVDIISQRKGKEKEREIEIEIENEKESESENECKQASIRTCPRADIDKVQMLTPEHNPTPSDYDKFCDWLKVNAPYCAEKKHFPKQITETQFTKLKRKYTGRQLAAIIEQIENRKDLRQKYTNLYRTVLNWAQKEYGN